MEDFDLWKEFLEYARFAPSPHNVQPWKIKILSPRQADLFYDPNRLLPDEDPSGRFLMTGFGIFIEILCIAAKAKGYTVKADFVAASLDSKKSGFPLLAHLSLVPTDEREVLDRELIKKRRTSRLSYKPRILEDSIIKELQTISGNFGQTFTFSSDPQIVEWALKLNRDTMFYDMNDDKARNEVGHWVRYSAKEAYQKKDGLWAYCMNTAGTLMYLFFHARWVINLPGIYQLTGRLYLKTTEASTVAWLQGSFQNTDDFINSGRMLIRLWLTMTEHGVYLHPFGSIITNKTAHERLRGKLAVDESTKTLWLIMRIGYSDLPPRSVRLDLKDILV